MYRPFFGAQRTIVDDAADFFTALEFENRTSLTATKGTQASSRGS